MDFDEIEFTEWQIEKVRVALNNYRITTARNGRLPSWTQVRDDIVCSDINIDKYSEDDAELTFKPEALRRFAARITVLGLDRLKDVTRFLLHSKIIGIEQLDEGSFGLQAMLAAHRYLATNDEIAKLHIKTLNGTYTAHLKTVDGRYETFTLRIIPDPSKEFVRVEETHEVSTDDLSDKETRMEREAYTTIRTYRTGYGFVVTEDIALHIFLNSESGIAEFSQDPPAMCVSYVQTGWVHGGSSYKDLCLLRNGPVFFANPQRTRVQPDGSLHIPNIFNFKAIQAPSIPST